FIESGRAAPSRDMVLRICGTMDVPLRQQNALLLAAGYAPMWGERDLSAPDLAMVDTALDYMLAQHEPYPAFVVDRRWNMQRASAAGSLRARRHVVSAVQHHRHARDAARCHPAGSPCRVLLSDGRRVSRAIPGVGSQSIAGLIDWRI